MNLVSIGSDNGLGRMGDKPLSKPMLRYCNWTLRNRPQWKLDQNAELFIHENASENIVCEMLSIFSRGGGGGGELFLDSPYHCRWYFGDAKSKVISSHGIDLFVPESWWRHQMETFSRYWPFVMEIHRSPVDSHHKGQWRGVLIFSLIYAWTNDSANNLDAGDLRRHRAHNDVIIMNLV